MYELFIFFKFFLFKFWYFYYESFFVVDKFFFVCKWFFIVLFDVVKIWYEIFLGLNLEGFYVINLFGVKSNIYWVYSVNV